MRRFISLFSFVVLSLVLGASLPQAASAQDRYRDGRYDSPGSLPDGGYQETCRDIRLDGDRLSARCRNKYGDWNNASLNVRDCRVVENHNGNLVCTANSGGGYGGGYGNNGRDDRDGQWGNGYRDLPPGGYRETCRDIRVQRDILSAYCETKNGDWNYTTLDLRGCRYGNVENKRGVLVCRR